MKAAFNDQVWDRNSIPDWEKGEIAARRGAGLRREQWRFRSHSPPKPTSVIVTHGN
jgi:hypothetical protein